MRKLFIQVVFILAVLSCLLFGVTAAFAADTNVAVVPAESTVAPGDTFTVNVDITPAEAIASAQFNLTFDPAVVSVTKVEEGNLFKQGGNNSFFMVIKIDNEAGKATAAGCIITPGGEVPGPGTFATVTLVAQNPGTSPLTLSNVIVGNKESQAVPVTVSSGAVNVAYPSINLVVAPENVSLKINETQQLTVTVDPSDAAVSYSSGNEAVATVNGTGLITAVGTGEATVTVTATKEGYNPATAEVPVRVEEAPPAKPDLFVREISTPKSISAGIVNNVEAIVANQGTGDAGSFTVELYASEIKKGKTGEPQLIGTKTVESLAAGSSIPLSFDWIPGEKGRYLLKVIVDPGNAIEEINEDNNELTKKVHVR